MLKCIYSENSFCYLTCKSCKKQKDFDKCEYAKKVKDKVPIEKIYHVREDVICKSCGGHVAYQEAGTLYPQGLNKEMILKNKKIYGKYYNIPHRFASVGFGGTIPYKCACCGEIGLIGKGEIGLEGYKILFEEKEK